MASAVAGLHGGCPHATIYLMNTSRGSSSLLLIMAVIGAAVLGGAGWWFNQQESAQKQDMSPRSGIWASRDSGPVPFFIRLFISSELNLNGRYTIDFGDGSSAQVDCSGTCTPNEQSIPQHTYVTAGTYTVRLLSKDGSTVASTNIVAQSLAEAGITFSASPTDGGGPLAVTFFLKIPNSIGYSIDFGDGSPPANRMPPPDGHQGIYDERLTHTYVSPSTYTATLFQLGQTREGIVLSTIIIIVR